MSMRIWFAGGLTLSLAALAACGDSSDAGSAASTTTGATGSSGNTTGTGGAGGAGGDSTSSGGGTTVGACAGVYATCSNSQACVDYYMCDAACDAMDQTCRDACSAMHSEGAALYGAYLECLICVECPIDCDGPGSGCN